jgi:hypothetical protein
MPEGVHVRGGPTCVAKLYALIVCHSGEGAAEDCVVGLHCHQDVHLHLEPEAPKD